MVNFKTPKLKSFVEISWIDEVATIKALDDKYIVKFDSSHKATLFEKLFADLRDGSDFKILSKKYTYDFDSMRELLNELDRLKLIFEGSKNSGELVSGINFSIALEDLFYRYWVRNSGESELTRMMLDGDINKNILIGFSLEFFHVTYSAHDALSPVISRSFGKTKKCALNFFNEEYRHDKMMLKAVEAFGIEAEKIKASLPLPATLAMMNCLRKWSRTDVLSYYCSLFIFEGADDDRVDYIGALEKSDFPDEFINSNIAHSRINLDANHSNATRDFLCDIEHIGLSDRVRIISNLRYLVRLIDLQHEQIVEYYSNPYAGIPRQVNWEVR